jgi:uncharacterized protein YbcI
VIELSNAMVALHRDCFGRGPGAARSFVNEDMAVCVLTDIYTPVERALIEAGQADHVRRTRSLYRDVVEGKHRLRAEQVLERPVTAFLSVVNVNPDVAIQVFLLGEANSG